MTDGAFIHAFSPSNLPIALAEDEMGVHPAALDLRQGVEGVPQVIETLHAFHQLLRGGLMHTGGILDPIVTVEGIVRLVIADTLSIGGLGQLAGPELGGHFIGNFDLFSGAYLGTKCLEVRAYKNARTA